LFVYFRIEKEKKRRIEWKERGKKKGGKRKGEKAINFSDR